MKIRIKKQHLAGAKYLSNNDCPLARALKGLGYRNVFVGGKTADATRNGVKYEFNLGRFRVLHVERAQRAGNKPFTITIKRFRYRD